MDGYKHTSEELQRITERLKDFEKLKNEFVSIVSHELRTPITAIQGYLWLILHNKLGGDVQKNQEYIKRAYESTERLLFLINDMLDVARLESGKMKFTFQAFDIVNLAEEVVHEIQPRANSKKITISVTKEVLPLVLADVHKIYQVLSNLIDNAVKFSNPNGTVNVNFDLRGDFVYVLIKDSGLGISEDDQRFLFKKFSRIESSFTSQSEISGTGLGLYICKEIVEKSGGKIWIESQIGKGSVFGFSLPIQPP